MSDEPPELGDVVDFEFSGSPDGRRWIVLDDADYDKIALDVDGNVAFRVDIDQAGEWLRLAAQSLAALSDRDAGGDDVLRDMIEALEREVGGK